MSTVRAGARVDWRPSLAAFLSFVFPGLGQAYNGQSALAWMLAVPVFLLVASVTLLFFVARSDLLAQLFDISFLVGLIVLDLAFLAWRLIAIVQAHASRAPLTVRGRATWVTGLLLVATLGMHVLPAYYAAKGIDTLNAVALGGDGGRGGAAVHPGDGRNPSLPEPSNQPRVEIGERVNLLLVGLDSAPGRITELTDTMLVVSLDPVGGQSAMISIPRDLYGVPLPDGTLYNNKLNSLLTYANARPADFPLGGVGTLKAAIGDLLGVRIHYFAAINLIGFRDAIDAVGGVDMTVERTINDPAYYDENARPAPFYLPAGHYHMDGRLALAVVRSRMGVGDSDFTRAERQQLLLEALQQKLTAGNLLLALPGLLDAVKSTIATDVPSDRMPELAQAVQDADMTHVRRIVLQPPEFMTADPFSSAGYILLPNLEAIRAIGDTLLASPVTRGPSE